MVNAKYISQIVNLMSINMYSYIQSYIVEGRNGKVIEGTMKRKGKGWNNGYYIKNNEDEVGEQF
jgi:hypothetical protein